MPSSWRQNTDSHTLMGTIKGLHNVPELSGIYYVKVFVAFGTTSMHIRSFIQKVDRVAAWGKAPGSSLSKSMVYSPTAVALHTVRN